MNRTLARAKMDRRARAKVLVTFTGALVGVMAAIGVVGVYVFVRFDAWGDYSVNLF